MSELATSVHRAKNLEIADGIETKAARDAGFDQLDDGKSATIEHSCDFHARTRGQVEAELIIVGHGVAVRCDARRMVSTPIPYASSTLCATPVSSNSRRAE